MIVARIRRVTSGAINPVLGAVLCGAVIGFLLGGFSAICLVKLERDAWAERQSQVQR